jgi:hypothetical protein
MQITVVTETYKKWSSIRIIWLSMRHARRWLSTMGRT